MAVSQDLLILLAVLEVATSTNSLEHLSLVQVVHLPQVVQAVSVLPRQSLVIQVVTVGTVQEAGAVRDQQANLETILTLLVTHLQLLALEVVLVALLQVILMSHGLHLELVWVQFLEWRNKIDLLSIL